MEAKNWKTEKETIIRCVLLNLAGVFIYAVGINSFAAPHKIAPGGASGIAVRRKKIYRQDVRSVCLSLYLIFRCF